MKFKFAIALVVCAILAVPAVAQQIGINVVLNAPVNSAILADLATHGTIGDVVPEIEALTMTIRSSELTVIQGLPYVAAANPDQARNLIPGRATPPGSWVLGPYQVNGQSSYYYLGGTSMATPHVAGTVALMAEKKPALTAAAAESILEKTAVPLPPGCRKVVDPNVGLTQYCWGSNASGAGLIQADAALKATK